MANKKIRELDSGSLTNNSDYFVVALNSGSTVKISYSSLATMILQTSLVEGSNVTITDATEQDGIKRFRISATATGSMWYFGDTAPVNPNDDDYWLRTDTDHYGDVDQYNGTTWVNVGTFAGRDGQDGQDGITPSINSANKHWMIGNTDTGVVAEGQDGATGATGAAGASISASATPITGGHRVTISSTDQQTSDVTFDVMDGTEIIQTTSDDRTVTLTVAGWTGNSAPYVQTVTVSGITASVVPFVAPSYSDTVVTGLEQQAEWSKVTKAVSGADSITFKCYKEKPTVELTALVKVV